MGAKEVAMDVEPWVTRSPFPMVMNGNWERSSIALGGLAGGSRQTGKLNRGGLLPENLTGQSARCLFNNALVLCGRRQGDII
jgi:hypothetical protein